MTKAERYHIDKTNAAMIPLSDTKRKMRKGKMSSQ